VRKFAVFTAALLSAVPWQATAEPVPPPSFAGGFELLSALGPQEPAKGAKWQIVGSSQDSSRSHFHNPLNEVTQPLQGKGWFIETLEDGKVRAVPFGRTLPVETTPSESPESSPGLLGKLFGGGKSNAANLPDLKKDVTLLIEGIAKLKSGEPSDPFSRDETVPPQSLGPLLLFATQLHQAGHPELADQLAWTIFQKAPSRELVIDAAIDSLGDELYQDIIQRFFATWDWQVYNDELAALVKKFPRGWSTQPAAAMVLDSLALRLGGNPPPDPRATGVKLTDEALNAITWMLENPKNEAPEPQLPPEVLEQLQQIPPEYHAQFLQAMNQRQSGGGLTPPDLWLLKTPEERASINSPATPLFKLGLDALPVLAALTADTYPIPHRVSYQGSGSYYYSSDDHPLERAIATHSTMARPATRGDVARALLASTLPDASNEMNPNDADLLRDLALDFHKNHQGKDWSDLAAVFMTEGSQSQKAEAAALLAKSPLPAHRELFEKLILESSPALSAIPTVIQYAQQRKAAAKPFIDRYIALVREEVGDGSDIENNYEIPWEIRQPGELNRMLKQLESLASGKSPQDMAREIARGPIDEAPQAITGLFKSLSSDKPQIQMAAMLVGAQTAEAAEIRSIFLSHILSVDWDGSTLRTITRPISESETIIWKKLLADDRPVFEDHELADSDFGTTLSELAACAAESCIAPAEFGEVQDSTNILKKSLPELCRQRIDARLAGQPIPPLPDPDKITATRLKEIITTAGAKPAPEIIPYLDSLTPDERAAWEAWFWEQDPPIPDSVRRLNMSIVSEEKSDEPIPSGSGVLNLKIGTEIHEDTLDAYIASLATDAAKHSLASADLYAADFPPGLASRMMRALISKDGENPMSEYLQASFIFDEEIFLFQMDAAPENASAIINFEWTGDSEESQAFWWVIDGKPVPFAIDNGEIKLNPDSKLPALIAAAREAAEDIYINIQVITRADAQRAAEAEDE
jgi:hypothetical protein